MVEFEFTSTFRHWVERARKHCVLCRALTLLEYRPGRLPVSEDIAAAAEAAGAGRRVDGEAVTPAAPAKPERKRKKRADSE